MIDPYRLRALKGWARRRLRAYIRDYEEYMGHPPKSVTVWAEDYDLLGGEDARVELKRGHERF